MQFQMRPEGTFQEYPMFRWLNISSAMAAELSCRGSTCSPLGESRGLTPEATGGPAHYFPQDVSL